MAKKREETTLAIDADSLDTEWLRQPEMYHEAAVALADAKRELDEAKNASEVVRGTLAKDIRERPGHYDLEKVTEAAVGECLACHDEFLAAQAKITTARYKADLAQALVGALDQRRKALENLVYLHGQDYFASPRGSSDDLAKARKASRKSKGGMSRDEVRDDD